MHIQWSFDRIHFARLIRPASFMGYDIQYQCYDTILFE